MNIYEKWIADGSPFIEGLNLLRFHRKNKILAGNLRDNNWGREKLAHELKKMNENGFFNGMDAGDAPAQKEITQLVESAAASFKVHKKQEKKIAVETDDAEVKKISDKAGLLYREMALLHGQLDRMDEAERGDAAFRILELDKELTPLYYQLDFYKKNGSLPEVSKPGKKAKAVDDLAADGVGLMKKRNSLKSYISKHKKDKTKTEAVKTKEKELAKVEDMLEKLK